MQTSTRVSTTYYGVTYDMWECPTCQVTAPYYLQEEYDCYPVTPDGRCHLLRLQAYGDLVVVRYPTGVEWAVVLP